MKLLSTRQRSALAQMARKAFNHLAARGQITGIDADTWRHEEVERVTGQPGLTQAGASTYNQLASHFADLAGDSGSAFEHLVREQNNPRRQMEHVLATTLAGAGLPIEYAGSIALSRWKKLPDDLDDGQFRQLLMTVKSRVASRRRAHSLAPPLGAGRGEGQPSAPPTSANPC